MTKDKTWIMMMVMGLLAVVLAACGGAAIAPVAESVAEPVADIDVAALSPDINSQTMAEIKDRDDVIVLDVREQWEYDEAHVPGVTLIPMSEIAGRLSEIPTDQEVVVTCRTGNRSSQVAGFLRDQGFDNIHNHLGGIVDWQAAGYPVE